MFRNSILPRRLYISLLPLLSLVLVTACSKQAASPPNPEKAEQQKAETSAISPTACLPRAPISFRCPWGLRAIPATWM